MSIRDAVPADIEALAEIHLRTWQSAYRDILPAGYLLGLSIEGFREKWRGWLNDRGEGRFHIAATDEKAGLVGFAIGGPERTGTFRNWGELIALYVLPACQRQGTGTLLFRSASDRFRRQGRFGMLSWMLSENPAGAFYRRMGGEPFATRMDSVGGAQKELTAFSWSDIGSP